jgi:hypothetical protein
MRNTCTLLLALLAMLIAGRNAHATTVKDMSLQELADHAGEVIIADIDSARSYWAFNPTRIETELTLTGVTYLKGSSADPPATRTLIVPGGTVGRMQMRLACAPKLVPGTRHILFLLPTYRTHPVVGVHRGAFILIQDALGVTRVHDASHHAVTSVDGAGAPISVHLPTGHKTDGPCAHGCSCVKSITPAATGNVQAMTLDDFLAQIQPVLNASRDHKLTEPAGRHVPTVLRATTLKTAPGSPGAPPAQQDGEPSSVKRSNTPTDRSPPPESAQHTEILNKEAPGAPEKAPAKTTEKEVTT